ncbi:3'-5' exonuclease [Sphingobium amiense]|uniref:3'-5' exonuclease n=1 Tax=Sphingobium amiense TaxID=135719 RepID=A0A494W023_9SPHN|nr:3'-5' exonuclease [Sphingobium amiense]BBD98024.1 3'-5' exonuclease [Sphingobium amiense]
MILGYDTETTGLPDWHQPSDAPHQPHVIQIAMICQTMDGTEIDRFVSIVKPGPGAVMEPKAFEAHGITLEQAMDEGVDPVEVTDRFIDWAGKAQLMVGHNESFDRRLMRIMAARHKGFKWEPTCPNFCTLYRSKFVLNLPATPRMIATGMPGPKAPNLGECVQHFFGETLEGAHDAAVDIEASLRVMWHLINEVGVPMFKATRSTGGRPAPRRSSPARQASGDPFAAAAALLGGSK